MSGFISAALRLLFDRRPVEGRPPGHSTTQGLISRIFHYSPPDNPVVVPPPIHHPGVAGIDGGGGPGLGPTKLGPHGLDPEKDALTFFRLMLGIQTWPYLGFTLSGPGGTRPAANIGLYARVVHSEQKAKDSFKVFSIVINGCYFLQIVIAAGLTALGAARASSGAVTTFGALNTVIAGFLTFLKGSGLPGRFKYYGNEWKKIREFIEQRERDFMRPGHNLNIYEVVETIEKMYNNLKADIELNTPDSYTSITKQQLRGSGDAKDNKVGGIDLSKLEGLANNLRGMDNSGSGSGSGSSGGVGGRLEGLVSNLAKKAEGIVLEKQHQSEKRLHDELANIKGETVREVQRRKTDLKALDRDAQEHAAHARAAVSEGKQAVRDGVESQRSHLDEAVRDSKARLDSAVNEHHARTLQTIDNTSRMAQEEIEHKTTHVAGSLSNLVREISDIHRTAVTGGREAAAQQIRHLAQRLAGHKDNKLEEEVEGEAHRDG
ncbi:hypothetical protein F5Y17DRAFT_465911 [Xylariaceae sp. FL0594]|nr:hypothetical protein F5Y17DRAFT_465911 [Xylariaceae sp. FL0594]